MKPRILFILHLPPPVHGAAMVGKYIRDSWRINEAFDCHYINLATAKDLTDIGKVGWKKLVRFAGLLHAIRREVKALRPDLVYVTPNACGGAFYKDFVVVEMLKRMGCRVVAHYHNKGVKTHQDRRLDNRLYRRFFRNLKVVLLASTLYVDVQKYVGKASVFFCPNGLPETADPEEKGKEERTIPRILFLSNLIVGKGVLVLLDALRTLRRRGCRFRCDIVGGETAELNGEGLDAYLVGAGLNDCVYYAGRRYGEEKAAYWREADVFVFPTFYANECFPLVNLEAMEWGLPIVTTDEGGIPDMVVDGENGLVVPCRWKNGTNQGPDPEELADALERLLADEALRRRMGENGHRRFETLFTLRAFEEKMTEALTWALTENVHEGLVE